ncbi:Protein Y11D7A.9 [Aphelenchoides avenae]|nr:Protein Y11D7A.9 [Aphelenchus avenae]
MHRVRDVNNVAGYHQYDMFPRTSTVLSNTAAEMREIQVPTPTSYCASTHKSPAYRDLDGPEYPAWRGRTPSCHPRRQSPDFEVVELMRLNPLHLFFTGFLPPFFGAVASIVVALIFHNDEISNYNWQCGRARLPSLSRIINLPMERIFWQFTFLFHIPLRVVELAVGCTPSFVRGTKSVAALVYRYGRLRSVDCRFPRFYTLARYLYAIFGTCELIFMVALSVVGEREFIGYHVIFFYLFGLFAIGFFVTNVICHASSLYYLNPYGRRSYYIKIVFTTLYIISVPILLSAFLLYWKRCITYMYDVFAITEYVDVFLSIGYHCCAFYDIRYKVIFSFRNVKPVKRD